MRKTRWAIWAILWESYKILGIRKLEREWCHESPLQAYD